MTRAASLAVWYVDVARVAPDLAEIERRCPRLSPDEEARAAAMVEPRDAVVWRTSRIALRFLLENIVGADMRRIPFAAGPGGKPRLAKSHGTLDFSLSHSAGHVLIGIADAGPVGVDLEQLRSVSLAGDRREALMAAAAAIVPDHNRGVGFGAGHFLQAWVRLEAVAKARGSGMGSLLRHLGLTGNRRPQGAATAAQGAAALLRDEGLTVRDLALPAGLFAAVAARDCGPGTIDPVSFPTVHSQIVALAAQSSQTAPR
jgi:4'-phosphopantetheinyl transferase